MQVQRSSHIIDKGGEAQRGKVTQLPSGRSEMKVSPLSHYPWDSDSVGGHESEFLINSQLITQAEAASNSHALVGRPQLTDGH